MISMRGCGLRTTLLLTVFGAGCGGPGESPDPPAEGTSALTTSARHPGRRSHGGDHPGARPVSDGPCTSPIPPPIQLDLPPGFSYCLPGTACAAQQAVATTCPLEGVGCAPDGRETTITWTLNGQPFDALFFIASAPDSPSVRFFFSPATPNMTSIVDLAFVSAAARARILEGEGTEVGSFTYYLVPPIWGGVTNLDFRGVTLQGQFGRTSYFRYAAFDSGLSDDELAATVDTVYNDEVSLIGRVTSPYRAFVMPTEMAAAHGGEGNYAFPPDTISVNYGHPDWLSYIGGFRSYVAWETAHELAHLFFAPSAANFTNSSCLNEGLADATGNMLGYVPESDLAGSNSLASTCRGLPGPHTVGNCFLWHLKHFGGSDQESGPFWDRAVFPTLFAPRRPFALDTCATPAVEQTAPTPDDIRIGDAWVVYFSDATGSDMTAFVVQSLGFFTSGSLPASLEDLGF